MLDVLAFKHGVSEAIDWNSSSCKDDIIQDGVYDLENYSTNTSRFEEFFGSAEETLEKWR